MKGLVPQEDMICISSWISVFARGKRKQPIIILAKWVLESSRKTLYFSNKLLELSSTTKDELHEPNNCNNNNNKPWVNLLQIQTWCFATPNATLAAVKCFVFFSLPHNVHQWVLFSQVDLWVKCPMEYDLNILLGNYPVEGVKKGKGKGRRGRIG